MIRFLSKIIGSRLLAWPLLALPGLYLWHLWYHNHLGEWKDADFQDYFGNVAVFLLVGVLCLTPLRVLFSKSQLVAALNRHRRAIGLSCFFYAAFHVYLYFRFAEGYQEVLDDIGMFFYIQAGLVGIILLSVLALTSNDLVVRILSYPLWKLIHRLAYVAAIALFIHRGFGTHDDMLGSTLALFAPLLLLEILRVLRQMYNFLAGLVHHMRAEHPAFEGVRKFRVTRKEAECDDITSFYLEPVDGRKLKPFKPGQFLTYELEIPGHPEPVVRCYSLSDAPHPKHYRASIKRVPAPKDKPEVPPGLGSNFFHDHVNVGDLLNVRAPSGSFHLNPRGKNPVVLIGSGIGLTPVLSMLKAMADLGSKREVWFFYGVRNKGEAAMQKEMEAAIARLPNGQLRICHSQPHKESVQGTDYHFNQRVTMDLLKEALPHNRYDFYFCGPGPMMQNLAEGFEAWGIPPARIHFEEFGPSTVKRRDATPGAAASATIFFKRSGKKLLWDGRQNSLLQFAESHGLKLRFGCRGGGCGTCKVRLLKGEILYPTPPGADPGPQYVLTCQGLPKGDLELDA